MDRTGLVATASGIDAGVQAPGDGAAPGDVSAATAIDLTSREGIADSIDNADSIGSADGVDSADPGTTDTRTDVDVGGMDVPDVSTDAPEDRGPADGGRFDGGGGHAGGGHPHIISVDFVGIGTPMAPTEIAGVIPAPYWNSAPLTQGSVGMLVAADGHATAAGVAWSADFLYTLGIPNDPGNDRMMNGYLDPFAFASVTVSGLPDIFATSGYDVYVYADGVVPAGYTRTGTYKIGAVVQALTQAGNTPFDGVFRLASGGNGGNYVVFQNITGASFTLTATPGPATLPPRSPLNGIQIVSRATSP